MPEVDVALNKIVSLPEAVERYVPDGVGLLAVGGMHLHNNAMALVREVIRQRRGIVRLLTSPCGALNADLLIGAGLVEKIVTSYVGFEHLGLAPCFRRAVESGTIRILECDEAYIAHGLYAGAGGLPFIPLPAGLEVSDVAKVNPESYRMVDNPFTGEQVLAGEPLQPDVVLLHALEADALGNTVIAGAHFLDRTMALASKTVLVQVERIVDTEQVSRHPVGTTIPGFLVQGVVEVPGGCHPTASHGAYNYDDEHLRMYLERAGDSAGTAAYLEEYVTGVREEDYLEAMSSRLKALRYRAVQGRDELGVGHRAGIAARTGGAAVGATGPDAGEASVTATSFSMTGDFSRGELMAVELAAHLRNDDVAVMGTASALPQVACRLAQLTVAPDLWYVAGGTCSVNPHLDPVVPSCCDYDLLRADTALPLGDVVLMEGRGDLFSIFFAGGLQIDAHGNCNLVAVGEWAHPRLRGPGTVGLPFLARVGRVLIYSMSHNRRTFVERVDFLGGPGFLDGPAGWAAARLSGGGPAFVVTPLCTMGFDPDSLRMRLVSLHPGVGVEEVRDATGFDVLVSGQVPVTTAPTARQLAILRDLDPDGLLKGR